MINSKRAVTNKKIRGVNVEKVFINSLTERKNPQDI